MKHSTPISTTPKHDYGPALQCAVSWLGERYLLAEPVSRRNEEPKRSLIESRTAPSHVV